jgi:hypothetical protein
MRANLTAPAIATWLCVGGIICIVWHVPWYVGALGGLAAAVVVYWLLVWMEPKWDLVPRWSWDALQAVVYAAFAIAWPSTESMLVLKSVYGALAGLTALRAVREYRRRNQA